MLGRAWQDAPVLLRPVPETLELALRPSRRLRMARRALTGLIALYVVELWLRRHLAAVPVVALFAGIGLWPSRRNRPRALRIEPGGSLCLQWHDGSWVQVRLCASTVLSGTHVLLVLRANRQVRRVLLGPDNLAPRQLAALRRRLRAGPARGGSALHSVAAPGSHSSSKLP